jgi:hypothetical protein
VTGRIFVVDKPERMAGVVNFLERLNVQKPVQVVVSEWKPRRTDKQNARYWVLLTLIADSIELDEVVLDEKTGEVKSTGRKRKYEKDVWHEQFKRKFLTPVEIRLPNGRLVQDYPSTSAMSGEAFSDYATQVEAWANERGVILPDIGG